MFIKSRSKIHKSASQCNLNLRFNSRNIKIFQKANQVGCRTDKILWTQVKEVQKWIKYKIIAIKIPGTARWNKFYEKINFESCGEVLFINIFVTGQYLVALFKKVFIFWCVWKTSWNEKENGGLCWTMEYQLNQITNFEGIL